MPWNLFFALIIYNLSLIIDFLSCLSSNPGNPDSDNFLKKWANKNPPIKLNYFFAFGSAVISNEFDEFPVHINPIEILYVLPL
jgi:hypothetical protein